jgi:hypothetical protein
VRPYRIEVKIRPNSTWTWKIKITLKKVVNIPIIAKFLTFAEGGPGTTANANLKKVIEIQ